MRAYSCWFTSLPNTDWKWSSNFPGIVRRTPLICWFTILNITAQELKLKFSQCVWHFPVDQLIAQSQFHWPENRKIRYSAQIPVDLLNYQTDHHWPKKKLKFYPEQVKFPVDMLTGNWSSQRRNLAMRAYSCWSVDLPSCPILIEN